MPLRIKGWASVGIFIVFVSAFVADLSVDGIATTLNPLIAFCLWAISIFSLRGLIRAFRKSDEYITNVIFIKMKIFVTGATGVLGRIIYIPLLLIAMHGKPDKFPQLTGKYDVKQLKMDQQILYRASCADSILTVVYFDIKNGCVFEFNTPQRRWNGAYTIENNDLEISWLSPADTFVPRTGLRSNALVI